MMESQEVKPGTLLLPAAAQRPAGGALVAWIHALRLEKSGGS